MYFGLYRLRTTMKVREKMMQSEIESSTAVSEKFGEKRKKAEKITDTKPSDKQINSIIERFLGAGLPRYSASNSCWYDISTLLSPAD